MPVRMREKLEQVRGLLAIGYVLDEVESGNGVLEARFRRGTHTRIVRFRPDEAEAILLARHPLL